MRCLIIAIYMELMKTVFITGASGQIGSYLSEIMLSNDYIVYGLKRPSSSNITNLENVISNSDFKLVNGDITDDKFINNFVSNIKPDIFVNCAAQSNVIKSSESFDSKYLTRLAGASSTISCLNAIRKHSSNTKFVTLGSSLMFGNSPPPQNENCPFDPKSPYALAKLISYDVVNYYRNFHNLFASNAICFNSESPRRPENYVSRKITKAIARIKYGLQDKLVLGNLNALRDFSHAKDTANAIFKIITYHQPDNFIVASGQTHSIQELVELAFIYCNLDWKNYVETDLKFFREKKENIYCGDVLKIRNYLNWEPKYNFFDLVKEMVDHDIELVKREI